MDEFQVQGQDADSTSLFFQKDGSIKGCFTKLPPLSLLKLKYKLLKINDKSDKMQN